MKLPIDRGGVRDKRRRERLCRARRGLDGLVWAVRSSSLDKLLCCSDKQGEQVVQLGPLDGATQHRFPACGWSRWSGAVRCGAYLALCSSKAATASNKLQRPQRAKGARRSRGRRSVGSVFQDWPGTQGKVGRCWAVSSAGSLCRSCGRQTQTSHKGGPSSRGLWVWQGRFVSTMATWVRDLETMEPMAVPAQSQSAAGSGARAKEVVGTSSCASEVCNGNCSTTLMLHATGVPTGPPTHAN